MITHCRCGDSLHSLLNFKILLLLSELLLNFELPIMHEGLLLKIEVMLRLVRFDHAVRIKYVENMIYLDTNFIDFLMSLLHDEVHHLLDLSVGVGHPCDRASCSLLDLSWE